MLKKSTQGNHLDDEQVARLHGAIDAEPAENWSARYNESQLRPETLHLMRQIGVTSPRSPSSDAA